MKFTMPHIRRRKFNPRAFFGVAGTTLLAGVIFLGVTPAYSDFDAKIVNNGNAVGTGTAFATVKNSGGTALCSSVPAGSSVPDVSLFGCSGSPLPATVTNTNQNVPLTLVHSGTASFAAGQVSESTCYPRYYPNSVAGSNPMFPRYNTVSQQAGPGTGASSVQLDGSTAIASSNLAAVGPQTFSIAVWFKTSYKQGVIATFSSGSVGTTAVNYDRILYMDTSGNVAWDTVPGGTTANIKTVRSSGTNYADGAWHQAVGVGVAGSDPSSISLYLDGALIGTQSITGTLSAENYTGYWRVGNGSLYSRTGAGSVYFNGYISDFSTFPTALTAAQVSSIYPFTSQTSYTSRITNLNPNNYWIFGAENTYTAGTYAGGATAPCAHVDLYVNNTDVGNLNGNPVASAPALLVGTTQTLNLGLATNGSVAAFDAGMHLDLYINVIQARFSQTFRWGHIVTIIK